MSTFVIPFDFHALTKSNVLSAQAYWHNMQKQLVSTRWTEDVRQHHTRIKLTANEFKQAFPPHTARFAGPKELQFQSQSGGCQIGPPFTFVVLPSPTGDIVTGVTKTDGKSVQIRNLVQWERLVSKTQISDNDGALISESEIASVHMSSVAEGTFAVFLAQWMTRDNSIFEATLPWQELLTKLNAEQVEQKADETFFCKLRDARQPIVQQLYNISFCERIVVCSKKILSLIKLKF